MFALTATLSVNATDYELWVGGTQVTSYNAEDIRGDGKFSYNASTKKLTIYNGAYINANSTTGWGMHGIVSRIVGLTIDFRGNADIKGKNNAMNLYQNTTITGNGSYTINLTGTETYGIYCTADLTIGSASSGGIFKIKAKNYAICNNTSDKTPKLHIIGPDVSVSAESTANSIPIYGYSTLDVDDGRIAVPGEATYNYKKYMLTYLNGNTVYGKAVIAGDGKLTRYNLTVGKVPLNNYNCTDIKGSCITSGKVSYDPDTRTLTLDNANINTADYVDYGMRINIWKEDDTKPFTMKLIGTNTITSHWEGIHSYKQTINITGSGSLKCNHAIQMNNADRLTFSGGCTVECRYIWSNESKTVVIDNSTVKCDENIGGFSNMILLGTGITSPAGGYWGNYYSSDIGCTYGYTLDADGQPATGVTIQPVTTYDVVVAGTHVHNYNKDNIKGLGITGQVSYNPNTQTLTLNNAAISNIETGSAEGIVAYHALNVKLIGSNTITKSTDSGRSLYAYGNLNVYGSDPETDVLTTNAGIEMNFTGSTLTLKDATIQALNVSGGDTIFYAPNYKRYVGGELVIDHAHVTTTGGIGTFLTMELQGGSYIASPVGGYYDGTDQYCIVDAQGKRQFGCEIAINEEPEEPTETYDLTIGGTVVNNLNKGDVLGDGVFSYNPSTKMLVIKGDYSGAKAAIQSDIDNLYVSFTRNAVLESTDETVMTLTGTTTLTSNSGVKVTLRKSTSGNSGIYHYGNGKYLIINNMDLTIEGQQKYGIIGAANAFDQSYLNISHSNINVTATGIVLGDFRTLALSGCYLTEPTGATIQNGSVCDANGNQLTNSRVIISTQQPTPVSVEDITLLIDRYLTPGNNVTIEDITQLIDRYLAQ